MKIIKIKRIEKDYSQQQMADMLGINRVTYTLSETGKRARKEDEMEALSQIFDISTKSLFLWKEENKPEANKNLNFQNFENLLLYILNKIGIKPNIGKTVLYKLLYFCDFNHYEKYGKSITWIDYIRLPRWPAPYDFDILISRMKEENKIIIADQKYMWYYQKKYFPNEEISDDVFSKYTKDIIDNVLASIGNLNASEASDYSHGDIPWIKTKDMEIIPYERAKERQYPYSIIAKEKRKQHAWEEIKASSIFNDLAEESDAYEKYR